MVKAVKPKISPLGTDTWRVPGDRSLRGVRALVAALAALALLASSAWGLSRAAAAPKRIPVSGLHIMNYYPSDDGWTLMWTDYSHATTVSDFQALASLGANTVRVIVQPSAVGYPSVTTTMRAEFDDMLGVAAATGLQVQLSLFDQWGNYSDISGSEQWVSSLLQGMGNDNIIDLVELRNEMPLTPAAIAWAQQLLPYLSKVLPGVPRTVSSSGATGLAGVTALLNAIPSSMLDVVDVHYYGEPSLAFAELTAVKAESGGRPVIVGETGESTYGTASGEVAQARYFAIMAQTTRALNMPPPAPWMLNDVIRAAGETLTTGEEYFGLRRPDGTWKPAATIVREAFEGQAVSGSAFDTSLQAEANNGGSTLLGAWSAFDSADGLPVVTPGIPTPGLQAVCYQNTGGSTSDNPALEQSLPIFTSGQEVSVSATLQRTGTGFDQVSIAYYSAGGSSDR